MGSYNWGYRGFFKGSSMGSFKGSIGFIGFRGSYKCGFKSPNIGYIHRHPIYTRAYNL